MPISAYWSVQEPVKMADDDARPSADSAAASKSVRSYSHTLFAEFGVRAAAAALDACLALYVTWYLVDQAFSIAGTATLEPGPVMIFVLVLYCAVFWSSSMRATPVQLIFGMRVIDEFGNTLKFRESLKRSIALFGLLAAIAYILNFQSTPYVAFVALVPCALLWLATVTPHRQGAHDIFAGSVVVNRKATKSAEQQAEMREFLADKDPDSRRRRRPPIYRMVIDAILLAAPLFAITVAIQASNQMNVRSRVAYALSNVGHLKAAVTEYYLDTARWPRSKAEAGVPIRGVYPDGGGYQLEDRGIIRIYFSSNRALVNVSLLLRPTEDHANRVYWDCFYDGEIAMGILPAACREKLDAKMSMGRRD